MRRIPDERISDCDNDLSSVYIEHWQAISADESNGDNKSLDYGNMLAVCSGNEKAPGATGRHKRRHFTCDKKRGNAELKINPLKLSTLQTLYYTEDGRIKSDDDVINNDIDIKLNLNCET